MAAVAGKITGSMGALAGKGAGGGTTVENVAGHLVQIDNNLAVAKENNRPANIKNRIDFINGSVTPVLVLILKYTLGYVVIFLFIYFLGRLFFTKPSAPSANPTQRTSEDARKRGLLEISNPYKDVSEFAIDRPRLDAGRTDQVQYFDPAGSYTANESGFAVSTGTPRPIQWNIDPTRSADYHALPAEFVRKNKGSPKLEVSIPWKSDGYNMTPDCSQAKYRDGTPATDILTDSAGSCILSSATSTTFTGRTRPIATNPGYAGLDKYATYEEPRCQLR